VKVTPVSIVTLRELRGEPQEMAELQHALEAAPGYSERVTGGPPGPSEAQSTLSNLPPGKTYEDKFVFGIYAGGKCVGAIDVIRGYPVAETAMLGLLLVAESIQRQGIGRAAYTLLEERIRAWGSCRNVRIGIAATNIQVMLFWQHLGFRTTGEVKPCRYGSVSSKNIILEREIVGDSGALF
jgi:GNAT superfamily N-acetyltransferase